MSTDKFQKKDTCATVMAQVVERYHIHSRWSNSSVTIRDSNRRPLLPAATPCYALAASACHGLLEHGWSRSSCADLEHGQLEHSTLRLC